uniref:SGNH hydrolase-type esterase domain-containing protein n=1 Tax=Cyprinus carpio carpio TaxID=630221 RepID=A0A9J8BQ77_CYPCA
ITPKSDYRQCKPQYPLKREAIEGITPVFESLKTESQTIFNEALRRSLKLLQLTSGPVHPGRDLPRWPSLRRQDTTDPGCIRSGGREPGPGRRLLPLRSSRSVRATLAEGKVHTHCFPGARVLDVSAQIPAILKADESPRAVVLHAGVNDTTQRQTETLKRDFRSLIETVRSTTPAATIIVSGPLPTYRRGHERLFRADGLHPSRVGAELLSDNISRTLRSI